MTWPLNGSEDAGDLTASVVLIKFFLLNFSLCMYLCIVNFSGNEIKIAVAVVVFMLTGWHANEKSGGVCIKVTSSLACIHKPGDYAHNCKMAYSLNKMRLQGIMVAVFMILDWIFTLLYTASMIPYRHVS